MKTTAIFFVLLLVFSSCTHRIVRTGYQTGKSAYKNCDIQINRFMQVTDSFQKIGEIKLGDSGFSVSCSEAHAIEILKNEACSIQADIINIIEENRPDLWSTCYRCRAEFYKYQNPQIVQSNELYKPENVNKRVSQDRSQTTLVAILALGLGFIIGFLLIQ